MDQEKIRKVMIGDERVLEMSIEYHILGWVESVDWVILGSKRPSEKRNYNMDGQVLIIYFQFSPLNK